MFKHSRLLALVFGLGLVCLWVGPVAADADADKIDKLIDQLGSGSFQEREAATKALDAIGVPALEKLRKATQSDDIEVKRRATDLVQRIAKRAEVSRLLTPKRVHLVYKDRQLKEAVEDFKKKSGYDIALNDPENKLADRRVTLDTGDVSFWEAFDQFCDKAGLMQISPQELMQQRMQEMMKAMQQKAQPPLPRVRKEAPKDKDGAAVPPPAGKE